MKKTTIVIGESASMPKEIIDKYGIIVVPFVIDWPDMNNLSGNNIFEKMRDTEKKEVKTTPKTSQPSIGVFKKYFDETLKESEEIVCITISSKISGTYNSAFQAKKMLDEETQKRIFILDSLNADCSESLLAIEAAEMAEQGKNGEEILKNLEVLAKKTILFGMIESPKWLEAGGRINHTLAMLLGQMQKIGMRPVLSVIDGEIKPANLRMQAKDTADALFKQIEGVIKKPLAENKICKIAISHADNLQEAQKLRTLLEDKYPDAKIEFINITSIVIGSHVGPGTLICCSIEEQ
jgi:DegV family protein with EDD domain